MALAQLMLIPPPPPACCCCCYLDEQRNLGSRVLISLFSSRNGVYRIPGRYSTVKVSRNRRRRDFIVEGRGRLSVTELQRSVENSGQIRTVEIPVTCYQIIGLTHQAEKDQIAKSVIRLENEPVKEGYTLDVVESRKKLLLDVRDKLFFEQEYAGNVREKVPPKSSLRIPWSWLPGALCLLEEVGEMKLVLEIGEAALQLSDAKPYVHDMLFSMALAECAIAKSWIDKSKVSQGFEALEHAQYLLTRIDSLRKVPLLSEIEEDLEMYCPVYILEVLGMPHAPQNADRRRRVIAILQLLLLQGLDGETSSSVHDWTSFLDQALIKLLATEIVDLLHWSDLAVTRKNKQSIESQNLRAVIDLNCFCKAMKAHIAVGFSSRQTDLINKAKIICECLVASDGMNLKFEEALCSFLLGQGGEAAAAERLQELEMSSGAASRNIMSSFPEKERNGSSHQSLEKWLKDFVLSSFPDTCDCSPSLANFFRGDKRNLGSKSNKQNIGAPKTVHTVRHRPSTFVLSTDHNGGSEGPFPYSNSTRQLGVAFKQLAPADLQSPLMAGKTSSGSNSTVPSVQLKRNFGAQHKNMWRGWSFPGDVVQRITFITVLGCLVFTTVKLFDMQFGHVRRLARLDSMNMKTNKNSLAWTMDPSLNQKKALPACIRPSNIGQEIRRFMASVKNLKHHSVKQGTQGSLLADDLMTFTEPAHTRVMPVEEAESLVKQWQTVKAEALGPDHEVQNLPEVLAESMLAEWHDLADSAKARSCFWRFVLLRLSVLRADILSDGVGAEMADIEALLEEAAELVDESQPKNPNYYSTYKIRYVLKRQSDGSWRFCGWGIQAPT